MELSRKLFNTNFFSAGLINTLPLLTQTIVYLIILRNTDLIGLGEYFMLTVFISFISLIMDLGISTTVIKYLSEFNDDVVFVKKIIIWQTKTKILLGFLVIFSFFIFKRYILGLFTNELNFNAYIVAIFSTILLSLSSSLNAVFTALNKFKNLARFQLIISIFLLLCVSLCVYIYSFKIYYYSIFLLLHSFFSFFLALFFLFKENLLFIFNLIRVDFFKNYLSDIVFLIKRSSNSRSGKSIFRFLFNISIGLLLAGLTTRIDVFLINKTMSISDVAVYGFFLKFIIPISVLSSTFATYISPFVNKSQFSLKEFFTKKISNKLIYLFIITILTYSLLGVYSATFLLKNELLEYWYLGSIMSIFSAFSLFMNPISLYGYNFGLDRYYPIGNILQLVVVCLIYMNMVSQYGLNMAVVAYASNFIIGAFFLFFLFTIIKKKTIIR